MQAMHMPADTVISGAKYDPVLRVIRLIVHHPDLQELEPGELVPRYTPMITDHRHDKSNAPTGSEEDAEFLDRKPDFEWNWGEPQRC